MLFTPGNLLWSDGGRQTGVIAFSYSVIHTIWPYATLLYYITLCVPIIPIVPYMLKKIKTR